MKNFFRENWIRLIVAFFVGATFYIVYLAFRNGWQVLVSHVDGLFFAAALLILVGLLTLMVNLGALDIFSYQFGRRRMENGKREDLYEYGKRKKAEREKFKFSFIAYLIAAVPYLIAFIIVYIVLQNTTF